MTNTATDKFLFTEDPTKNVDEIIQCHGESVIKGSCKALKMNPEIVNIITSKSQFLKLLPGKLLCTLYWLCYVFLFPLIISTIES